MTKKLTLMAALTLAAPMVLADGPKVKPGNYHVVVTHEMIGLPFTPPPTVIDKCVTPADAANPQTLAHHNEKCEQTAFKSSGNKLSFTVTCHERGGTQTGSGEMTFGADHYSGLITVTMQNPRDGSQVKIINHMESTRTGDCPPAK